MMVTQLTNTILFTLLASTLSSAMPVLDKRRIVTRVHTASTTNTVTDYYSTTTEVEVGPTVEFIVNGDATYTTTLYPAGVDSTVLPDITITSVVQKDAARPPAIATGIVSVANVENEATSTSTIAAVENTNVAEVARTTSTLYPAQSTFGAPTQGVTTTLTPSTGSTTTTTTTTSASAASTAPVTSVPNVIVYSPYNNDGSCKTYDTVYSDLSLIKSKGIYHIRMYGTDCNSLQTVQPVSAELGIKINQGLWISAAGVDSLDSSLSDLISYGQTNGWDIFDYITIGNEAINSGYCSVSDLIGKISSVKSQLQAAGYTGQVTTSEPPVTFENHPELCTASEIDFVGINPHSYFDENSTPETAGTFVKGQVEIVQNACGTSNVVVTETGFPSQGIQNGGNIPSKANQIIAIQQILNEMNCEVTILSTYNDFWKDPGVYGIEQYFGVIDILP